MQKHNTAFNLWLLIESERKKSHVYLNFLSIHILSFLSHLCNSIWRQLHPHEKFHCTLDIKKTLKKEEVCRNTHISEETKSMSNKMAPSFHTLPVELVYRILDNLDQQIILFSFYIVCTRLDVIIDTYHWYQIIFGFIMKSFDQNYYSVEEVAKCNLLCRWTLQNTWIYKCPDYYHQYNSELSMEENTRSSGQAGLKYPVVNPV